jgi:hypothetical protein
MSRETKWVRRQESSELADQTDATAWFAIAPGKAESSINAVNFHLRAQLKLTVAMRVCNPDRSPVGINR